MKAIVVIDKNWAIGKDGGLLIHLPGDLANFKRVTMGKTVVMGRKTLESLPGSKPLPGRKNIVLSRGGLAAEGVTVCNSMGALFKELVDTGEMEDAFIIGGEQIYKQFIPYCNHIYVTKIEEAFPEADSYFPNLDELSIWQIDRESETFTENGVNYRFTEYRRK